MESSKNIAELSKSMSAATAVLDEYDRLIMYRNLAEIRAVIGGEEGADAVDDALDLYKLTSNQIKLLEKFCRDSYGIDIADLRVKISQGGALVSLYQDSLRDFFKISYTYEILDAADAFDDTGEIPEESREGYENGLKLLEEHLNTLSSKAPTIFPSLTPETEDD